MQANKHLLVGSQCMNGTELLALTCVSHNVVVLDLFIEPRVFTSFVSYYVCKLKSMGRKSRKIAITIPTAVTVWPKLTLSSSFSLLPEVDLTME